jgi:hypothetical protein
MGFTAYGGNEELLASYMFLVSFLLRGFRSLASNVLLL